MKTIKLPKLIERLDPVIDIANTMSSLASAFPNDSRPRRFLEPIGPAVTAMRDLLHKRWLRQNWDRWQAHKSRAMLSMIETHAPAIARMPTDNGALTIYELGDHRVAIESGSWSEFRATADRTTLAQGLVSCLVGGRRDGVVLAIHYDDDQNEWSIELEAEPPPSVGAVTLKLANILERETKFGARSVLLHGPPGTGKTVAARQLGARAGVVVTLSGLAATHGAVELALAWHPDAIVIDDVDHAVSADRKTFLALLGQLERARDVAKLIVMTANDIGAMTPGDSDEPSPLLRRGRVDHLVELATLDRDLAVELAPELPPELAAQLADAGATPADLSDVVIRWHAWPDERENIGFDLLAELKSRNDSRESAVAPGT